MYVGIRLFRIVMWRKEHNYVRWAAGVCLLITLVMAWNIIAESRFRFEPWRSYAPQKTMVPVTRGEQTIEELGIPEEGIIKK
jgi:hypothetical protein